MLLSSLEVVRINTKGDSRPDIASEGPEILQPAADVSSQTAEKKYSVSNYTSSSPSQKSVVQ